MTTETAKNEVIFHPLQKKMAEIIIPEWDWEFNMDDMLTIRYDNIFGEIITIPVLENRVGRLVSELREYKKQQALKLDIKEAEVRKLYRNESSSEGRKKPTIQEENDHILLDPVIRNLRYKMIRIEKDVEDLESFYDAVKSKAFKLNNLSKSLQPEEFEKEMLEGAVNNVMIRMRDKRFS
jgi:hypothetical protein